MTEIDTHDRIDLTGPWAGFGFQGGHMFTPEGHHLEVQDMVWWSLTCNIAREWRQMMAEARLGAGASSKSPAKALRHKSSNVIHLRDALQARRQKRIRGSDPGPAAETSNVVHIRRGPTPRKRG